VLAVEHARTHPLPPGDLRREFDDTAITFYRAPGTVTIRPPHVTSVGAEGLVQRERRGRDDAKRRRGAR
jgi:hypothetical protein